MFSGGASQRGRALGSSSGPYFGCGWRATLRCSLQMDDRAGYSRKNVPRRKVILFVEEVRRRLATKVIGSKRSLDVQSIPCSVSLLSDMGRYGCTGLEWGVTEMAMASKEVNVGPRLGNVLKKARHRLKMREREREKSQPRVRAESVCVRESPKTKSKRVKDEIASQ
ncbi:hypothetical protein Taro_026119 [Colocasia esculenta]|uniref:Uncharacterized protein n=1 Tax=Colocasia esculenta TaxID=4460 RepID=A0A843VJM0_COLES|nr:hypothetical protein [Colocasia esculenta]